MHIYRVMCIIFVLAVSSNAAPNEVTCEEPVAPVHGSLRLLGDRKVDSLVLYLCDDGWMLVGASAAKCHETGQWTSPPPRCIEKGSSTVSTTTALVPTKASVPPSTPEPKERPGVIETPDIPLTPEITEKEECSCTYNSRNRALSATVNGLVLQYGGKVKKGDKMTISCSDQAKHLVLPNDTNISGTLNLTCDACQIWTDGVLPSCGDVISEITCREIDETDMLKISYTDNLSVGSIANFHCFAPGILSGMARTQCLSTGMWSHSPPTCKSGLQCDPVGSLTPYPSRRTGLCRCKPYVTGARCNQCKPHTFYLNPESPLGCIDCFCMGITETCSSCSWHRDEVILSFTSSTHGVILTNILKSYSIRQNIQVDARNRELVFRNFATQPDQTYYWRMPPSLLGDKVTAYGGRLNYTIMYIPGSRADPNLDPDVQIMGNGIQLIYRHLELIRSSTLHSVSVPMYETSWLLSNGQPATRENLLMTLADLDSILIKATYTGVTTSASFADVSLSIAVHRPTDLGRALAVEQCRCPIGYTGLSCEDCDDGYTRSGAGLYLGLCEPCFCNSHSNDCEPETGICTRCRHNTVGDFCELCADGHYGDATRGTPQDCKVCPCPLTSPSNQFSPTCFLDNDSQPTCNACPPGYVGRNCGKCAAGYRGTPVQPGGRCEPTGAPPGCPADRFRCSDGTCIPVSQKCNGQRECRDGSDERNCRRGRPTLPRVTIEPHYQEVKLGDPVEFRCIAEGFPEPQLRWTGGRNNQLNPQATFIGGFFRIAAARKSDEAEYFCSATNSAGSESMRTILLVKEEDHGVGEEPQLTITPSIYEAQRLETVRFECRVTANPTPSIIWSFTGGQLSEDSSQVGGILTLPRVTESHQGVYVCTASNIHGTAQAQARLLIGSRRTSPTVRAEPERQTLVQGTTGELRCIVSGIPKPTVRWSKVGADLSNRHKIQDDNLYISDVAVEDRGVYLCRATNRKGSAQAYVIVEVERREVPAIELYPEATLTVIRGGSALFHCRVTAGIPTPTVEWIRADGSPFTSGTEVFSSGVLRFNRVTEDEEGTYICTAENSGGRVIAQAVLRIAGVVPYFSQASLSYMRMPTLPDAYLHFEIEIAFKPESMNGLILYNGQKQDQGDFLSLVLNNAFVEFRYELGSGPAILRSKHPVEMGKWHVVKISRKLKKGVMTVDDQPEVEGVAQGKFLGLDLVEPMYIGSVPDFGSIEPNAGASKGFIGCISHYKTGNVSHNLLREAEAFGTSTCETCASNPCLHGGVCQEALTMVGYSCICPPGFSGRDCEIVGEACYPGVCGEGRCFNRSGEGFDCYCPLRRIGVRCEKDIVIIEPAFSDGAYIAYPTPKTLRTLKMNMKVKPRTTDDCLIAYCAQSDDGSGDFTSIAIRNKRVEFRFDMGSGPAIIRSSEPLLANEWLSIVAERDMKKGSLIVNNGAASKGRSPGVKRGLSLNTPFYVGAVDKHRLVISPSVEVQHSFDGCIAHIELNGVNIDLVNSAIDSSNVEDCGGRTPCAKNPCLNEGICVEDDGIEGGYVCECQEGFSGINCEIETDLCILIDPCKNGGTCIGSFNSYKCSCPLRYKGLYCEETSLFDVRVSFEGNGYIALDSELMPHTANDQTEVISFSFSTTGTNGLLLFQGQKPESDGKGQDYLAVAVVDGYLEFSYELGSGPSQIKSPVKVNDGKPHTVILHRIGQHGSLALLDGYQQFGASQGLIQILNTDGDIYIGGVPNHQLMTANKYPQGLIGCVWDIRIEVSGPINLYETAKYGANVDVCEEDEASGEFLEEVQETFLQK